MTNMVTNVKGMNDVLPEQCIIWQQVERCLKQVVRQFGFDEIRFPIVEKTELFKRSIGDLTDIVQKEMYTFEDAHNGDLLTLRPEGTAPCVRACMQHGLLHNQIQRLWYMGPLFRHERPQKGRYRQFHQFGVEAFGYDSVGIELELLAMNFAFWQALGLSDSIQLQINSIGTAQERLAYQEKLTRYLNQYRSELDADSLNRLDKNNPLRILDSKNTSVQALLVDAPKLEQHLSSETKERFEAVLAGLDKLAIPYQHQPNLVRGLDYYSHTVFEWTTEALGAQGTVSAGGRYDALVTQLGGKPTPAAGFAMGIERLVLLVETLAQPTKTADCDVYVVVDKSLAVDTVLAEVNILRKALPRLRVKTDLAASSLKSQLKRANQSQAQNTLVFGNELYGQQGKVRLKDMANAVDDLELTMAEIVSQLTTHDIS